MGIFGKPQEGDTELYAKRHKIHPRGVNGLFNKLRNLALYALLGIYYFVPWINWNGQQAVLFDLPARKFYIFGLTIWPQDFFFLAVLLIIAAVSLFFFTTLYGRLWCGYACPQTVWANAMMWIEAKIEGPRNKRIKLDSGPWNAEKITKKGLKYLAWAAFSLWTGLTFVGYFVPIRELFVDFIQFSTTPTQTFWIGFYAVMIWLLGGVMREQVCIYMCPYARFQSVMFDPDTLIISYDEDRGETRGKRRKGSKGNELGHCVDCSVCVQVCPMGIDIRDGLQYQCIGCALCIDGCNEIMDKLDLPPNLIKYTTENSLAGSKTHVWRPRVFVYGTIILALLGAVAWGIADRDPVAVDIMRDRGAALYRDSGDGNIENLYRLRIMNKDDVAHTYQLEVDGLQEATLLMDAPVPMIESGAVLDHIVRIKLNPESLNGVRSTDFGIRITAEDAPEVTVMAHSTYLGPID